MKFKIDLKIFLLIILFLCTNQIKIYGMMMLFAIIHELGHLIAGIILKMKPNQLKINPLGISIEFDIKNRDYNIKIQKANLLEIKKIIVALAGPLTNFIIILILRYINIFSEYVYINHVTPIVYGKALTNIQAFIFDENNENNLANK